MFIRQVDLIDDDLVVVVTAVGMLMLRVKNQDIPGPLLWGPRDNLSFIWAEGVEQHPGLGLRLRLAWSMLTMRKAGSRVDGAV